jgi:hypothetical protein
MAGSDNGLTDLIFIYYISMAPTSFRMDKNHSFPSHYLAIIYCLACSLIFIGHPLRGQDVTIDGKAYQPYKAKYFKPKRPLQYNLYLSPVLTVDPLGLGGKSTYGIGAGSRINLWESKSAENNLQGLKIKGFYTAFGYELFPRQSDNVYASLWLRVKTFMPLAARIDYVYSYGNGLKGMSTRYCVGFEIKNISLLLAGTTTRFLSKRLGDHPYLDSPYSNVGSILLVIPVYNHYPQVK